MMRVEQLMTASPITVASTATLKEAAEKMRECDIGCLPVVDEGRLVGLLTDRDIVVRAIAQGLDIGTHLVQEVMSRDLITGAPDMDAEAAARVMQEHKIRRLPVVQNDQLVGICSLGDMAANIAGDDALCHAMHDVSTPIGPKCAL